MNKYVNEIYRNAMEIVALNVDWEHYLLTDKDFESHKEGFRKNIQRQVIQAQLDVLYKVQKMSPVLMLNDGDYIPNWEFKKVINYLKKEIEDGRLKKIGG